MMVLSASERTPMSALGHKQTSLGMKTGQQQHRNKSEYTRRHGKIEDFGCHTFETKN